jgi:predicted ATPase/DNA-binding CsgD family transcriptional regulator
LDFAPAPFAPLIEALRDAGVTPPADTEDWEPSKKRARLESFARALQQSVKESALLLAIDDLQWADEGTRDLLRFLGPSIETMRLAIVAAYRTDELHGAHPLHAAFAAIERNGAARHTILEPLGDLEMRALLRNAAGAQWNPLLGRLRDVAKVAEGNPLVAEELVRDLREDLTRGGDGPMPLALAESVLRRLATLPGPERFIVTRAAAIGRDFDTALLVRVSAQPVEAVRTALREAIALRLIDAREPSGRYAFRSTAAQRVVLGDLLAEERRELHAAIATALEAEPDDHAPELAHHWWEAGEFARAARYAEAAGDAAAQAGLANDAAGAYERALVPELEPATRIRLEAKLLEARRSAAAMQTAEEPVNRQGRLPDELTQREFDVALRVAAGKKNHDIAGDLSISTRTVEDYVSAILRKLELKNRAELAAYVARHHAP